MKRDECSMSAERLCESDAQAISLFATELRMLDRLLREGHTRQCAEQMLWGDAIVLGASCTCKVHP